MYSVISTFVYTEQWQMHLAIGLRCLFSWTYFFVNPSSYAATHEHMVPRNQVLSGCNSLLVY